MQAQLHRDQTEHSSSSSSSSSSSNSMSLVSRARTAFHSAAAKAEKVITEIKADLKSDRDRGENEGQSLWGSRRGSEQDLGKLDLSNQIKEEEVTDREVTLGEVIANTSRNTIPSSSVIKQLASAFETGRNFNSINDLSTLDEDPLPVKEKTGSKFSVVKSIVRREKEDKSVKCCSDEKLRSLIRTLFDSVEKSGQKENIDDSSTTLMFSLPKDIRGAPPESFVVRLCEIIGEFKSMQEMASFWGYVVMELRKLWTEGQPIPHMPLDGKPDLNSCLLHQQLQAINCCIARKHRRVVATESLDSVLNQASLDNKDAVNSAEKLSTNNMIYARTFSGNYVLRLGADHPSDSLTMLETGEPIYSPIMQEGPVLTEEIIKEAEELVLRTGSVGAGCSQLLSDMQAFKAANPGCVLEDFIRWHSPPDWTDMETDGQATDLADIEGSSRRGRLSARMQKEGNLWRELWESAKPLPAIKQAPLFDEDLAVDTILTALEDIQPSELFEQLFISALCSGFLIAEDALPPDTNLSKLFYECKDYVNATCQIGISIENIRDICKVYETIEMITVHPKEAIMIVDQSEEPVSGEPKSRFRKINLNFMSKDKPTRLRKVSKDEKIEPKNEKVVIDRKLEDKMHVFSNFFDKKPSLFSRKPSKTNLVPCTEPDSLDGSDWTIV